MLIDTHAHIYNKYYDNIDEILNNANFNNVTKIINCATSIDNFEEIIKYSNLYGFYYALGIHPEEINEEPYDTLERYIVDNLNNSKFVAIGEIGLDYYHNKDNILEQKKLFEFQLNLAQKYNLPVIVHSREATNDTINILKKYKLKGIIHCFSGSVETANEYIRLGYKLGIGGLLTFKNCNLKENIGKFGLENIVLETDSPYVTPEPYRGSKNEPSYLLKIAQKLSNILNLDIKEIEEITTKNCNSIFDFYKKK